MDNIYIFNKTVKGYLHELKNISCEDYSDSLSDKNHQFYIVAVADGHGDITCMRSDIGSREAVRIAVECLKDFAQDAISMQSQEGYRTILEQLETDRYNKRPQVLEPLTNTIISKWHTWVYNDIKENPLTENELDSSGRYEEFYRNEKELAHIYGTTLIAALMLSDFLVLIQQGDGRCDVFYEDGTVEQPIPWDEKCFENMTTSMCDKDAAKNIRSCIISLKDKKVIACYLGTDGVEDFYSNMEGTHNFYRGLTCELNERKEIDFFSYLNELLPEFSRQGSGDDISVGGIIDMNEIASVVPMFLKQVKQYDLEEELERFKSHKISMHRKHTILKRLMEEAKNIFYKKKEELNEAVSDLSRIKQEYQNTEQKESVVEQEWKALQKKNREQANLRQSEKDNSLIRGRSGYLRLGNANNKDESEQWLYDELYKEKRRLSEEVFNQKSIAEQYADNVKKAENNFRFHQEAFQELLNEVSRCEENLNMLAEKRQCQYSDSFQMLEGQQQAYIQINQSISDESSKMAQLKSEMNTEKKTCGFYYDNKKKFENLVSGQKEKIKRTEDEYKVVEEQYECLKNKLNLERQKRELDKKFYLKREYVKKLEFEIENTERKYQETSAEFEVFDDEYQNIQKNIDSLERQIKILGENEKKYEET